MSSHFDGWDGLGASAVLRAVAQRLTPSSKEKSALVRGSIPDGLEFEQIVHIDCSKWVSRRALQRVTAEQLGLPAEVMGMFDKQDEEDDFAGVAQGSRTELQPVIKEISQHIQKLNHRFLVIFHNGSSEEIDLANCCGFPLSGFSTNKVLWTFQGRFRLKPRAKVDTAMKSAGATDMFIDALPKKKDPHDLWFCLVHEEASELTELNKINTLGTHGIIDQPSQVAECFMYMLELCRRNYGSIDYDLAIHGKNYWICDGVIKQVQVQQGERDIDACDDDDGIWRTAEALEREMQLDVEYNQDALSLHLARCVERKPYWTSQTCGIFLLTPTRDIIQQYFNKLRVLKFSRCTFNLASPPFLCCHSLRFLWIDHCNITGNSTNEAELQDGLTCFQTLWVLDVRYTDCRQILSVRMMDLMTHHLRELHVMGVQDWDMGTLRGRLPNIRKLRVTKSKVHCSCSEFNLFTDMNRMELLDFSGNTTTDGMSLYRPGVGNKKSCLQTVIIDTCYDFKRISLRGCTNLKNILLSGWLLSLGSLDISGTKVKTLDLTTTYILGLGELYLLGCEMLCAIMWPPKDKRRENMDKLHVDTTQGSYGATESSSLLRLLHGSQVDREFDWYISVRDTRLLMSLEPLYPTVSTRKIYLEISSTNVAATASKNERTISMSDMHQQEPVNLRLQQRTPTASIYGDILVDHPQQANDEGDGNAPGIMWMWPCPDAPHLPKESCYMYIQDKRSSSEQGGTITVPDFVVKSAKILHVRDSLSITVLPSAPRYASEWYALEWCRIERCPKLECVFAPDHRRDGNFVYQLKILWASQLPKARYIWKWSENLDVYRLSPNLTSLHLDCCPRLIHVLPISCRILKFPYKFTFQYLGTLEIMWCGDLRVVFSKYLSDNGELQLQPPTVDFPKLKHIHLHELPRLHSICDDRMRISALELETLKIRGCWSLKRLPIVEKAVHCDCEKEWWDTLEWEDDSQRKLYRPIHSKYYKKATLLRVSVLR